MKQLTPMILREKQVDPIEEEIMRVLIEVIYRPLARALEEPEKEIINSKRFFQIGDKVFTEREIHNAPYATALSQAVAAGTVWHREGHFYGSFNSRITKELRALGARYNARSRTWSLTREFIPAEVQMAQAKADSRYDAIRRAVLRTLDDMRIESIDALSTAKERYGQAIDWMNDDFQKTVRSISIPPTLTPEQKRLIAQQWGQNLDLYVKDWASENILKMRQIVQSNTFEGNRAEQLVQTIQKNFGASKTKAKFLARQETALLMSKFQETRYRDIGSEEYRWSGADDARERPDHKALNGKVFRWDSPPVTNRKTGARNNPGEDFGCRCVAIPLVR